jgi:hypothetical protein
VNPILFWLVVLGAPVAGLWLWVQNIRRGERHMKQRLQGPFVPEQDEGRP